MHITNGVTLSIFILKYVPTKEIIYFMNSFLLLVIKKCAKNVSFCLDLKFSVLKKLSQSPVPLDHNDSQESYYGSCNSVCMLLSPYQSTSACFPVLNRASPAREFWLKKS